jgi:hypothetical protein
MPGGMVVYVGVPQAHPHEGGAKVPLLDLKAAQAQQAQYSQQRYG